MRIRWGLLVWMLGLRVLAGELALPPPVWSVPEISAPRKKTCPVSTPRRWVSWNLHWFPGETPLAGEKAKRRHEKEVRAWLERLNPEVGIFQEVLSAAAMKRGAPQLPWQAVTRFARAEDEETKLPPQNLAICSTWPWKEAWQVDFASLPLTPDRPVRGFLGVEWETKKGERWTVYAAHLKSNRGGRAASSKRRELAMAYLRLDWKKRGLEPSRDAILVAGDFNCSLQNPEFAYEKTIRGLLMEGWISITQNLVWPQGASVRPDAVRGYPATDFDHILISPGWKRRLGAQELKCGVDQREGAPSDHWPVWLTVEGGRKK